MKKLKLYGTCEVYGGGKKEGFIATVLIKNGVVRVDNAITPYVQSELLRAITAHAPGFLYSDNPHGPGEFQRVGDPFFLEALRNESTLWYAKTYDGWSIVPARCIIIDE